MKLNSEAIRYSMTGELPGLKRRRWNWRKAAENLLILAMLAFVVVVMPIVMFVSCTGGR